MALFKNETHQAVWIESHCVVGCWRGKGVSDPMQVQCPILAKALRTDRKPVEWTRNPRGVLMAETIKCEQKSKSPGKYGGTTQVTDEESGLFDVELPTTAMDSEHQ